MTNSELLLLICQKCYNMKGFTSFYQFMFQLYSRIEFTSVDKSNVAGNFAASPIPIRLHYFPFTSSATESQGKTIKEKEKHTRNGSLF